MRVYIFHSRQFRALVISLFFHSYEPYDDITLDDVHQPFHPLIYPTHGKSDSNTCLTLTYSVEFDPSEPSYISMIRLSLDSSSCAMSQAPPRLVDEGSFVLESCLISVGELVEEDVEKMHSEASGMDSYTCILLGLFCRNDSRYWYHGKSCWTCYNYCTYI